MDSQVCVVCEKGQQDGHPFVKTISPTSTSNLLDFAQKRTRYGETQYAPLADRIKSLNPTELEHIAYHRQCYQNVVHKRMLERAEKRFLDSSSTQIIRPAKIGRPSTSNSASINVGRMRRRRSSEPKHKSCALLCSKPCDGDLHLVQTDAMGKRFLEIRDKTKDDNVRSSLSLLQQPGDASAHELWYHRDCLRNAERQCDSLKLYCAGLYSNVGKCISDIDIINAVNCSLSSGVVLNMNDISEDYMSMLSENGVTLGSSHYKKHLKLLIKENVPGVEFVKPHRLNESEQVMSSRALAEAVDNVAHQGSEEMIKRVADVAKVLRGELLNHRDTWHFAGSMSYENPPMVAFFLKQLLFGTNSKMVCEKRDDAVNKTISIVSQILVQNVRGPVKHIT